jgi:hypothetical protein
MRSQKWGTALPREPFATRRRALHRGLQCGICIALPIAVPGFDLNIRTLFFYSRFGIVATDQPGHDAAEERLSSVVVA